jgi:hypothetical protein
LVGLVQCILLAGCSHEANIRRWDGIYVEGKITHSDKHALYVRTADGQTLTVPGEQIAEIDNPGTFQLILGAGLLLVTASIAASNPGHSLPAKLGYVSPSLALLGWGGYAYFRSDAMARKVARSFESPSIVPPQDMYLPAPTWNSLAASAPKISTQPSTSEPRPILPTTPLPNQPSTAVDGPLADGPLPVVYAFAPKDFETNPSMANALRCFVADVNATSLAMRGDHVEVFIFPESPMVYQRIPDLQIQGADLLVFIDLRSANPGQASMPHSFSRAIIPIDAITQNLSDLAARLELKSAKVIILNQALKR